MPELCDRVNLCRERQGNESKKGAEPEIGKMKWFRLIVG
jgi:hypothetical protein